MASSSTPSSSITTLPKKHEVFLSFRGEDTRHGFTSHLYDALCRKKIETFIDDHKLERGDEISPALLRAIEGSKIAVVIFSKNYAFSKWCLRELAEIMKCKKLHELIVMPVFYHVDPSDVRKLNGSFKCSFANEEKALQDEVQKWREALTEASNIAGWDSSVIRNESKLVGDIVESVWRKLMNEYISASSDFEGLIGIHERIEQVMSLLCLDMEDVRIIGIWGMGGIGKTTIAQAVFNLISYKFNGVCFIEKVGKRLENDESNRLQLEVLSEVLHEENLKSGSLTIRPFIKEMLNQKKVFIVLDDVNKRSQLKTFVESLIKQCGLGSRIIITSRDKQVLYNFNIDDHKIYVAEGFNDDEALELFHKHANPTEDCMALSKKIVNYAKGNPLALEVLGSSLKGKSKSEWESALDSLQGNVNSEIFDVLKISYDGLEEKEQNLFLDIACFEDLYNDGMLKILDKYSLSVLIAKSLVTIDMEWVEMHELLQEMGREIVRRESPKIPGKRSRLWERDDIIRILKNNTGTDAVEVISLDMDDLEDEDIDLSPQVFDNMHNLRFLLFHSMNGSDKVHLSKGLNCLPDELRILNWHGYPLRVLPSNFNPKQLVKLDLSGSNIEQFWEGTKHAPKFPKLKWLILSHCTHLSRIPNLSDFPLLVEVDLWNCKSLAGLSSSVHQLNNLRDLNLYGCNVTKFPLISGNIETLNLGGTAIEEVPSSIQSLTNLTKLDLSNCTRLKHISASICKLKSLSTLNLRDCFQLETFPEILETMEFLKSLDLSGSAIELLPTSIEHLNGLQHLTLSDCKNLEMLPSSICNLTSLEYLHLSNCKNLERLPSSICNLTSLKSLDLSTCSKLDKLPDNLGNLKSMICLQISGSGIGQLPSSITCLEKLRSLDCSGCRDLTILPPLSGLHSSQSLDLIDCSQLETFPEILEAMEFLKSLNLSGSAIKVLPPSIEHLNGLRRLTLSNCKNLEMLPSSICNLTSLEDLLLCNCSKLDKLPNNLGNLKSLKWLDVSGTAVGQLPSSITCLENLEILDCSGCRGLTILPHLSGLCSLRKLYSKNCSLMEIPEDIGCLSSLKRLELSGNMFESLPKSIKQLSKLEYLSLSHCKMIRSLPELPGGLECLEAMDCDQLCQLPDASEFVRCRNFLSLIITCLENLEALDCSGCSLMEIPEDFGCLSSLKELKLSRNMFESLPKSIKQLSKLEFLSLSHCKMLRSIPELPEGLECLEAMDCDQLCQVPDASEFVHCINSKSHHSVKFIFTNSLNLIKAVSNVFEESLRIMQHTEKGSGIPSNAFSIYLPGNKIPEWFSYPSPESSVNIRVLRNDLVNRKFMGFAICAVLRFDEYNSRCENFTHRVRWNFEIYHDHINIGGGSRHYPANRIRGPNVFMDLEHMLLGYYSFHSSSQNLKKLPISNSDYLDILIEFISECGYERCGCNGLKRCAVHPIYAEEPIEIIGATIQEIGETSGRRSDRSDDNDKEVEPHPKRICTQEIKILDLFH